MKDIPTTSITNLCSMLLDFGKVERLTCHQDGTTHESDTDHTVMLTVVACAIAHKLYKNLDTGLVAELAIVHDILEVHGGDTPTLRSVTPELLQSKKQKEEYALNRIRLDFGNTFPWLHERIEMYERCECEEAKFIKILDKMMPKITVVLNQARFLLATNYVTRDEAKKTYDNQRKNLLKISKNFPEIMDLWEYFVEQELSLLK